MTPSTPTAEKIKDALDWADNTLPRDLEDSCKSDVHVMTLAAAYRAQQSQLEAMAGVVEAARKDQADFEACMMAQKNDTPLPDGHDDPDESCGDYTCFHTGDRTKAALAALDALPSTEKP